MSKVTAKASPIGLTDEEKIIIDARLEKYHQNPESGSPWENVYKRIVNPVVAASRPFLAS